LTPSLTASTSSPVISPVKIVVIVMIAFGSTSVKSLLPTPLTPS